VRDKSFGDIAKILNRLEACCSIKRNESDTDNLVTSESKYKGVETI